MDAVKNISSIDLASIRVNAPVTPSKFQNQPAEAEKGAPIREFQEVVTEFLDRNAEEVKEAAAKMSGTEELKVLEAAENQVEKLFTEYVNRKLSFEVDEETGKTIIKLLDKATGEVVRQIPPQEFLDMVSVLNKVAQNLTKDLPRFI